MEKYNLEDFIGGWFVGDFMPTLYKTTDVEVAVKKYYQGQKEESHYHKIATEFTVIIEGQVLMSGTLYKTGDIIKITPGISTDFEALSNVTTLVVKIPGAQNDKFFKIK
jgi:hypothetical protein